MRHAKSSWSSTASCDFDRPLSVRGKRDCKAMGNLIASIEPRPQQVLCSSAKRTRSTWRRLQPFLDDNGKDNNNDQDSNIDANDCEPIPAVFFSDELYASSLGTWLQVLHQQHDNTQCVLLIGHNPELQSLLLYLAGDQVSAGKNGKILPTATLCVLDIAAPWHQIREDSATLINIYRPRELSSSGQLDF